MKTQRNFNFNKPFMDKLERQTFSRPKRFLGPQDRQYINTRMTKDKPLLIIMFEGVIGFTQYVQSDFNILEERVYTRRDCQKGLATLSLSFNVFLIFPREMRQNLIQSILDSFPSEILQYLTIYQIQLLKKHYYDEYLCLDQIYLDFMTITGSTLDQITSLIVAPFREELGSDLKFDSQQGSLKACIGFSSDPGPFAQKFISVQHCRLDYDS